MADHKKIICPCCGAKTFFRTIAFCHATQTVCAGDACAHLGKNEFIVLRALYYRAGERVPLTHLERCIYPTFPRPVEGLRRQCVLQTLSDLRRKLAPLNFYIPTHKRADRDTFILLDLKSGVEYVA